MRWTDHEFKSVAPELRRCRFCTAAEQRTAAENPGVVQQLLTPVESPEHALFQCPENAEVCDLRKSFMQEVLDLNPHLKTIRGIDAITLFKMILYERKSIARFAQFAHEVLELYYAKPLAWRDESKITPG